MVLPNFHLLSRSAGALGCVLAALAALMGLEQQRGPMAKHRLPPQAAAPGVLQVKRLWFDTGRAGEVLIKVGQSVGYQQHCLVPLVQAGEEGNHWAKRLK